METPVLNLLSILHTWANNQSTHIEVALSDADDGEKHSVKEAKEQFEQHCSEMIESLQRLRVKCQTTSYKQFINEEL